MLSRFPPDHPRAAGGVATVTRRIAVTAAPVNEARKVWIDALSVPRSSFAAIGNGGNIIWIDPDHDIVLVWHRHEPGAAVRRNDPTDRASVRE